MAADAALAESRPRSRQESIGFPPASIGWRAVAVLTLLYWFGTLDRQVAALLLPAIKADLRLSDTEVSLLTGAAFGLFFSLASLPVGWLVDRVSRRLVLFFGVMIWSTAGVASGFGGTLARLFAARAVVGAGEAAVPTGYSMLADLFPPGKLSFPLSIFALGGNLGSGMSFIVGGLVMAWLGTTSRIELPFGLAFAGWQFAFILTSVPGLFFGCLIWTIPEPVRHRSPIFTADRSTYADLWRHYRRHPGFYLAHNLGFAILMCFSIGVQTWNVAFLTRVHHWDLSAAGFWLGAGQIGAATVGLALHGWAVDRLFRSGRADAHLRYFVLMCLLAIPCSVCAYLVRDGWLAVVLYNSAFFFIMSFVSVGPASLQITTPPAMRGKASSFYVIGISLIGTVTGPTAVALLTDHVFHNEAHLGWSLATFAALTLSTSVILFFAGLKPMRRLVAEALPLRP